MLDLFSKLFSMEKPHYRRLSNWLHGKITPGDEQSVRNQLEQILEALPEERKKAFKKYIESNAWKKIFVRE